MMRWTKRSGVATRLVVACLVAGVGAACQDSVRVSLPDSMYDDVQHLVDALPNAQNLDNLTSEMVGRDEFLVAPGCPTNELFDYMDNLVLRKNGDFIATRDSSVGAFGWLSQSGTERRVQIYAVHWGERADYRTAKDRLSDAIADPCITTSVDASILVEPLSLPGLPETAMAAVWHSADDALSAFVYDDERQLIVMVAWQELPGPTPTDDFVDVVNKVWSDLLADVDSGRS